MNFSSFDHFRVQGKREQPQVRDRRVIPPHLCQVLDIEWKSCRLLWSLNNRCREARLDGQEARGLLHPQRKSSKEVVHGGVQPQVPAAHPLQRLLHSLDLGSPRSNLLQHQITVLALTFAQAQYPSWSNSWLADPTAGKTLWMTGRITSSPSWPPTSMIHWSVPLHSYRADLALALRAIKVVFRLLVLG